jgi:hypothetical protein
MSNINIALFVSELIQAGKLSSNVEKVIEYLEGIVGSYDRALAVAEILEKEFKVSFVYQEEDNGMPTLSDFSVFL